MQVNGHPDLSLPKRAGGIFGSTDSLNNSSADANQAESGKVQLLTKDPRGKGDIQSSHSLSSFSAKFLHIDIAIVHGLATFLV